MDYLPYEDWLHVAESLPEGQRTRINHTCGNGRTMTVSHDDVGYSARCFRCNIGGSKAHGMRRLSDIDFQLLRCADYDYKQQPVVALPTDYTQKIPSRYAAWFYRAGIFHDTAVLHGFGWSESMARVILPVYEGIDLVYIQARAVHTWRKPKYLNQCGAGKEGIMWKGVHSDTVKSTLQSTVYITEDILSALRLYLCGYNAVSSLGTTLSDGQVGYLSRFKRFIFWYDGDTAGYTGSAKGMKKLGLLGKATRIITERDPKLYSNREIGSIITNHEKCSTQMLK